jgi:hypothetical protein
MNPMILSFDMRIGIGENVPARNYTASPPLIHGQVLVNERWEQCGIRVFPTRGSSAW